MRLHGYACNHAAGDGLPRRHGRPQQRAFADSPATVLWYTLTPDITERICDQYSRFGTAHPGFVFLALPHEILQPFSFCRQRAVPCDLRQMQRNSHLRSNRKSFKSAGCVVVLGIHAML